MAIKPVIPTLPVKTGPEPVTYEDHVIAASSWMRSRGATDDVLRTLRKEAAANKWDSTRYIRDIRAMAGLDGQANLHALPTTPQGNARARSVTA